MKTTTSIGSGLSGETASDGQKFLVVDIVVRNNSDHEGFSPNPMYFKARCSDGVEYDYDLWATSAYTKESMGSSTLSVGASKVYSLAYEVPQSADLVGVSWAGYKTVGWDSTLAFELS